MRTMVHAALPHIRPHRRTFQLFEVNIVMDESYHLWVMGVNSTPLGRSQPRISTNSQSQPDVCSNTIAPRQLAFKHQPPFSKAW